MGIGGGETSDPNKVHDDSVEVPDTAHQISSDSWLQVAFVLTNGVNSAFVLGYSGTVMVPLGWVGGVVGLILAALVSLYANALIANIHELGGTRHIRYRDLAGYVYGKKAYKLTWALQYINLFMINTGFIILAGSALKATYTLFRDDAQLKLPYCIAIAGFVCALFAICIPHLSALGIWLAVSTVFGVIYIAIASVLSIKDGIQSPPRDYTIPGEGASKVFETIGASANLVFAYNTGMLPEIQATIKQPVIKNMMKSLYFQFTVGVIPLYLITFSGYWAYGSSTETYLLNSTKGPVWVKAVANISAFLQSVIALHIFASPMYEYLDTNSFQRQLNYFGFRKWTKSKTDICTFSHPFFRENQPELLQLIKRKKAPRRTPASTANNTTSSGSTTTTGVPTSKKLSPCGKRKHCSTEENVEGSFPAASSGMHIQMNTSAIHIQPAMNGMPLSAMTTPHGASSNGALGFSHEGLARQYLPELNNVISPVAATECKKKAKKLDKKDYLVSSTMNAPLASPSEVANSLATTSTVSAISISGFVPSSSMSVGSSTNASNSRGSSDNGYVTAATPTSAGALPTLNIVRSRLIQRQQVGGPEQQQAVLQQQQQRDYNSFPGFSAPSGHQGVAASAIDSRPERLAQSMGMTRADFNPGQSPVFSNSFNDPVNILLRIKKSRASSSEGKDVRTNQEQGDDQNENLASLHNYLLGNSLYTNRLQAQLKLFAEENQSLKHMLDTKQHEVDTLQSERKALQQENAVLLEDKNKLFEINRDLLGKLFPQ